MAASNVTSSIPGLSSDIMQDNTLFSYFYYKLFLHQDYK